MITFEIASINTQVTQPKESNMFEVIVTLVVVVGFGAFLYSKRKKKIVAPGTGGGNEPPRGEIGINEEIK